MCVVGKAAEEEFLQVVRAAYAVVKHVAHGGSGGGWHGEHMRGGRRRSRALTVVRGGRGGVDVGRHVQLLLLEELVAFLHVLALFSASVLEPDLHLRAKSVITF